MRFTFEHESIIVIGEIKSELEREAGQVGACRARAGRGTCSS